MVKKLVKKKILNLRPSATLAINEKSQLFMQEGKKIYRFGFGQSPFPVPEKIVETLKENAHKKDYLPMQGLKILRNAISDYLNIRVGRNYSPDNILITPGSKEAMILLHVAFNGEIILPAPSWVSYSPQAQIGDNKVHWLETKRENNWFPSAHELENKIKKINKNNIILILNSPNNPSGTTCNNLEKIAKIAKKYKIIVLSDEIYTDITFKKEYLSISKYYPEGTCITGGLSKWCGAGGWRLGFFAAPKNLKEIFLSLKSLASESFSSVNAPTQFAAVEAYTGDYSEYILKTKNILKSVGMYVYNHLKSNKILINPPQGGFYLMPEFVNKKFKNSSDLCKAILNETGVAMLPGSAFGFKPKKMLTRLSFTDFDGAKFLNSINYNDNLNEALVEKFAPNVVEGTKKLSIWAKKL